jgi:hypothetical protein
MGGNSGWAVSAGNGSFISVKCETGGSKSSLGAKGEGGIGSEISVFGGSIGDDSIVVAGVTSDGGGSAGTLAGLTAIEIPQ